ncbi:MAG: 30S ribosome-binding factor RbfA [Flavobacteriales bacterium]|jgi:ribosome-binding factor A|nr:30S ribosome-binding factor RbfA [Flavobacteriales bacterium]MBT7481809.1 30S ribosome-binding factor RbfA [Flavobacteriales bacterium]|tara:strand:+ start:461 stop:799 length:339 start_codon:yes stop_codon:yes gene_type:complete
METKRQKKVSKLIQKELSVIFQKETHQFLGNILVTVTGVRISPDLSVAKAYLSIFPVEKPKDALAILNENKKMFRTLLGNSCRHQLRIVPELIFYLDDSAEYAEEIDRLLNQ